MPDPDYMMSGALFWRTNDARFEQLLQQAREATNLDERLRRFQAADRRLIQSAIMNPILYGRRHYLIKPWVRHYPLSPINRAPWKDAILEPHE